jgi:hypothetical protein
MQIPNSMKINLFVTRIFLIISILILNYANSYSQTDDVKIERITINHCGDSLIPQKYELDVKSKRVYFITPFANYLDIKGEKYRDRVKVDKNKREEIFKCVDHLNLNNLVQTGKSDSNKSYYVVEIFFTDNTTNNHTIPDELLPSDFKKLYDTIIDK